MVNTEKQHKQFTMLIGFIMAGLFGAAIISASLTFTAVMFVAVLLYCFTMLT